MPNDLDEAKQQNLTHKSPLLANYSTRAPIASERYPPNAMRFENIDKMPICFSKAKKTPAANF